MKKAKIMLMAIAVLVIVGGTTAFKLIRFGIHPFYTCDNDPINPVCTIFYTKTTLTTLAGVVVVPYAPFGAPCTTTVVGGPLTCTSRVARTL